jgi:hypothetical protein
MMAVRWGNVGVKIVQSRWFVGAMALTLCAVIIRWGLSQPAQQQASEPAASGAPRDERLLAALRQKVCLDSGEKSLTESSFRFRR